MPDFKMGEVVVCVASTHHPEHVGCECEVVRPYGFYPTRFHPEGTWGIGVKYPGDDIPTIGDPKMYRRKDPPKERQELGEWDLCPWRPERITVSEEASHG